MRRQNEPHFDNVSTMQRPAAFSLEDSSIWQTEADDEEWSAWIDAAESTSASIDQEGDKWVEVATSTERDFHAEQEPEVESHIEKTDLYERVEATVLLKGSTESSREPRTFLAESTGLDVRCMQGERFDVDDDNVFSNPWKEDLNSTDLSKTSFSNCGLESPAESEDQTTRSSHFDVQRPGSRASSESKEESFRFGHGNDGFLGSTEQSSPASRMPGRCVEVFDDNLQNRALARDERQRQLIIEHCKRSHKLASDRASRKILANAATLGLLAWIHAVLERMKARAKSD